jgi:6-phosphofructokinase 1
MNPFLRALVRLGLNHESAGVLGVKDGFEGLVQVGRQLHQHQRTRAGLRKEIDAFPGAGGLRRPCQPLVRLDHDSVRGLAGRGGIVLGTARAPAFQDAPVRRQVINLLADLAVDAVVVCGGNGALADAERLAAESGLQVVGIPASIDNDVPTTETALGVDTAANTIVRAIEQCSDTAAAHRRILIVETMGRQSGDLARIAALATGAEILVTPERGPLHPARMRGIANRLEKKVQSGRAHGIVVVAEGVRLYPPAGGSAAQALARFLDRHFRGSKRPGLDLEIRVNVLGHVQRGGPPTAADRLLAVRFAKACWKVLCTRPRRSGVVGLCRGRVVLRTFARGKGRPLNGDSLGLYDTFKGISRWR